MKPRWSRQANLDVSDEESSDLQFAEYYTLKQMRHLARAMCAMLREHSTRIREVISINPTVTMQRLLNRTNIVANRLSDDIVEVEMCHSLNKKEYQFKPSPDECVIPIRINQYNTTLFLNRHTQILHRSKETAKEENCGPTMNVIIDGQVYEYNRMTGKTTPIKEQAKQVKLEEKDQWHFLDQQYIFKDIILHKSNVFQNCHLDYLSAPKLIAKFIFESTIKRFVYVLGEFVIIMIWTCAFKKQLFASIPAFVEVIISWRFLVLPQSFPYLQKNIFFSTIVTTFVIACLKKNLKISLSGK
uniref:Neur_chan_LBD domain-containing protein n=2 Tax=Bursaphelenchus xylophilus TaxID=6326 RepID=A0A1I7SHM9_BURXY